MPANHHPSSVQPEKTTAETLFREAFDRLKHGAPILLPVGTPVSQNNVAKEAGRDPSALRKSRYFSLVSEIQHWISEHGSGAPPSERQKTLARRAGNRTNKQRTEALKAQRDHNHTLLIEAKATILEYARLNADLKARLEELKPSAKVTTLPKARK